MLKASIGTGILAMPNAFKNAGYVVGTIGTLFAGFLCTYCMHLLVRKATGVGSDYDYQSFVRYRRPARRTGCA